MGTINRVPGVTAHATPPFPEYCDALVLGTAAAESWTAPANVHWVIISPTGAIWANTTATATVPGADVTDGTASFRIPTDAAFQIKVGGGDSISFIREGGSSVTVSISCWTISNS